MKITVDEVDPVGKKNLVRRVAEIIIVKDLVAGIWFIRLRKRQSRHVAPYRVSASSGIWNEFRLPGIFFSVRTKPVRKWFAYGRSHVYMVPGRTDFPVILARQHRPHPDRYILLELFPVLQCYPRTGRYAGSGGG